MMRVAQYALTFSLAVAAAAAEPTVPKPSQQRDEEEEVTHLVQKEAAISLATQMAHDDAKLFGGLPASVVEQALQDLESNVDLDLTRSDGGGGGQIEIDLPVCAWRQSFNNATLTWNVEYPDEYAIYMGMFIRLDEGDALRINGTYPSSRYTSFNTYSMAGDNFGEALTSFTDRDLEPSSRNPYANVNVPAASTKYSLGLTPDGNQGGYENEMRAFDNMTSGFTLLLLRFYNIELLDDPALMEDTSYIWGFVDPPTVEFTRAGDPFRLLKQCKQRQDSILPYIPNNADNIHSIYDMNRKNNFNIPDMRNLKSTLNDFDNQYMEMVGHFNESTMTTLVGRAQFKLPVSATPASGIDVADDANYEVRYSSFSTYNLAPPRMVTKTMTDEMLVKHYAQIFGEGWDRQVVVWMALNEEDIPAGQREPSDIVMPWATRHDTGGMISQPGAMFRQILTQTQRIGNNATFINGIADVCPTCDIEDTVCCNWSRDEYMPDWCEGRVRTEMILKDYYPKADWWIDGVQQGPDLK